MSRKTIGENPLDALLLPSKEESKNTSSYENLNNKKHSTNNKQRLTVQISQDVIERAKNAVYWTRGLTLAQLTEEALAKELRTLEKNSIIYDDKTGEPLKKKGEEFPERTEDLKSGRPFK